MAAHAKQQRRQQHQERQAQKHEQQQRKDGGAVASSSSSSSSLAAVAPAHSLVAVRMLCMLPGYEARAVDFMHALFRELPGRVRGACRVWHAHAGGVAGPAPAPPRPALTRAAPMPACRTCVRSRCRMTRRSQRWRST
jgi:hypothetical protein